MYIGFKVESKGIYYIGASIRNIFPSYLLDPSQDKHFSCS